MMLFSAVVCALFAFSHVRAHSWVECTNYDKSIDIENDNPSWDDNDCAGYARDRKWWIWHAYAANSGIDYHLFEDGTAMCEASIGSPDNGYSDTYDTTYPMATYTVGETIRLLWPAKNHAGYECQSDQLDHEMQLFVNLIPNPTSDPTSNDPDADGSGWTLVHDWHTEYEEATGDTFTLASCTDGDCSVQSYIGKDNVPFQNCPHFCDDTEGALCYGDFVVPNIFPEDGYYTFVWYWAFKANEIYTHCFEAYVSGTDAFTGATNVDEADTELVDDDGEDGGSTGSSKSVNKSGGNSDADSVSAIVWSLVIFIILLVATIMICLLLKKNEYIVCTENSIVWNGGKKQQDSKEIGLATVHGTGATHAISPMNTNDTAAKRPPPPPMPTNA